LLLFDFLLRSGNFKGSLKKDNEAPRVFLFGLFIWPNWEIGNQSHQAIFCTLAAAIVSPRSLELKQEAKKPTMEEAKRCKLKLPVEIKRTACIRCGGRVPTKAIASRNPVKKENIPTPVRRSARIQGMKRKDYKEVSPEPKDYGGSDYSDDRSPSSWAVAGRDDNDLYIWDEVPKEKTPEGPNDGGNDGGDNNGGGDDGRDPGNDDPFGLHPMCCAACRHSIADLYALVDECFQAMEAMRKCLEDLERVVEDDYKFLNRNVLKLFGMVGNMSGK
jgi:RNase P subunit RPR2